MESLVEIGAFDGPEGARVVVDATPNGRRLTMRAEQPLSGMASGWFDRPAVSLGLALGRAPDAQLLGLAFTQFALPVVAGPTLDFDFRPAPNLHSPRALGLLLVTFGDRTTLLAPISGVHEQFIAVTPDGLRWGWHGDLDAVPGGFETVLGVYEGTTAGDLLEQWAHDVCNGPPRRRRRDANPLTSHVSYWTDNGAAYWYRTEPGRTIGATVTDAVRGLRDRGVPVLAVELDSWFYPHEVLRPIAEIGYPAEVPPTGMWRWEPRDDAFDTTIEDFASGLGRPPLVLHSRHVSPRSPYVEDGRWWVDALAAQPEDPAFFRRWFDDAARWGACCIEQDWMLMYWFGVRELRAAPGRALAWQSALDRHAGDTGVDLMWCMATPADLVTAASLPHVIAVRTSDDYRFAEDPALLWIWYLTVNRVAAALGLPAFKDVFFSATRRPGADSIDGDPHAELEALLSALSAGPVGVGDRLGRTDTEVVMRTCDADGRIRHVDRPIGLTDGCLFGAPARGERLAWSTTTATVGDEVWTYVVAINVSLPGRHVDDRMTLATLGIDGSRSVLDWRRSTVADSELLHASLAPRDWKLYVVAPPQRRADAGDLTKYVTMPCDDAHR